MRWVKVCSALFWFQEAVLWWAWAASWMCLTGWTLPNWPFITRLTPPPSGSETTVARGPLSPANSCVTKRQVSDTHTQRESHVYVPAAIPRQFPWNRTLSQDSVVYNTAGLRVTRWWDLFGKYIYLLLTFSANLRLWVSFNPCQPLLRIKQIRVANVTEYCVENITLLFTSSQCAFSTASGLTFRLAVW